MKSFFIQSVLIIVLSITGAICTQAHGQNKQSPEAQASVLTYKQIDTVSLNLTLFYPSDLNEARLYPAIVFFFGGGWTGGSISQFEPQARYFASRGMLTALADYRTARKHATTPFDAVADAKSAIRFMRANAAELKINPNQIIASGGSAGGHLAAATAIIKGLNDPNDQVEISCIPNAMILYNPVIDNGPEGYGFERIGDRYLEISPYHNIKKGIPPTVFFLGTKDKLIPVETGQAYKTKLENLGSRCDLHLYAGQEHGFFNLRNLPYYLETVYQTDLFLSSLGYLKGEPEIKIDPALYHNHRQSLDNCRLTFENSKMGRVAFLGGSITYNSGWRTKTVEYLQNRFPETEFEFIHAGIPSMGSVSGAFRISDDVLSKGKIDLLFVEAAVNDAGIWKDDKMQIRGMEGIIRQAKLANPEINIIQMHFVDPGKMESYRKEETPIVILNHEKVAKHYNISSINLALEVTERIDAGEFSWEDDFKNLHPSPFGQIIYFNSIKKFLEDEWSANPAPTKLSVNPLPQTLDESSFFNGTQMPIEGISASGWEYIQDWSPNDKVGTRQGFVHVPILASSIPGSSIEYKFKGKAVGILVPAGPDTGILEFRIDKEEFQSFDLFTRHSKNLHLPRYYILASGLKDKKHKLTIRISEERNSQSVGNACRIQRFLVN
ncbi:MAG: alpha/beta hydrolase fold domain-containing protein [Bacteroidales bacterium]|nr:alpha/beta hydrolase fold domain-containing protein [Bacteroidales bacterium]